MKEVLIIILIIIIACYFIPAMAENISLDDREIRDYIKPTKASPMDTAFTEVSLSQEQGAHEAPALAISLDGAWDMVEGVSENYEKIPVTDAGVTVSSTFGSFVKGRLVDGILTSTTDNMWVSDGATDPKPTITYDLGSLQDVKRVDIYSGGMEEGHYVRDYEVLGSVEGQNWTTLDQREDNSERAVQHEVSGSYRYIRIHITTPCLFDAYSRIYEVEVYREVNLKKVTGLSVIDSSGFFSPFDVSNLVDGAWANEATDEWVSSGADFTSYAVIDIGKKTDVSKFIVRHNAGAITADFRIDGSNNNADWTAISTVTGNTQTTTQLSLATPASYRYLRLYITKPNTLPDKYARVYELEVYEKQSVSWDNPIVAQVPGSVHTALYQNGLIPDPYVAKNDSFAREASYKSWWFKKTFTFTGDTAGEVLSFGGICESGTVWLNGQCLGDYKGMFTAVEFDVSDVLVQGTNEIIVKNNSAPYVIWSPDFGSLSEYFTNMNTGWATTVTFNCGYGWLYANMPAIGIWRSVKLERRSTVQLDSPFIAATDANAGLMDFYTDITGENGIDGNLVVTVKPENFEGLAYTTTYPVNTSENSKNVHLRFNIPNPKLWWPNGMGEQNLYTLETSFIPTNGAGDYKKSTFGIRTIEMQPAAGVGLNENYYNWTFVINGQPMFLKGSNWCTIDAMMRFDYDRYDRFLTLGKNQGLQLLRSWGGGMVETDEFYDLCNRYGICVYQEWPTAWDSYKTQPSNALYDTVSYNTKRLRNNPSLIMWGGGNEGAAPLDNPVLNTMGRLTIENDGTRPWHRQDSYGGSLHEYDVFFGAATLDHNVNTLVGRFGTVFIGEFGLASLPNRESVNKYLPADEQNQWPPDSHGSFLYHFPLFNTPDYEQYLAKYTSNFVSIDSIDKYIIGSQLAQSVGTRHALERARASWPNMTGACYYKLTDVYPAATWSTVDSYGVPKLAYYTIGDSYENLTSVMLFDKLNIYGTEASLPIYLLDDANELKNKDWTVTARAFNGDLNLFKQENYSGSGQINKVLKLGDFTLSAQQTATYPLFIVLDTKIDGKAVRNYYYINYEQKIESLFNTPKTRLSYMLNGNSITVKNIGEKPAFSVNFNCENASDTFLADDNFIWLDPNESQTIHVNNTDQITGVSSWNKAMDDDTPPSVPADLIATEENNTVKLLWTASTDAESGISQYKIYRDGSLYTETNDNCFIDTDVYEYQTHTYTVSAINGGLVESAKSSEVSITIPKDILAPKLDKFITTNEGVTLVFSERVLSKDSCYKIPGELVTSQLQDDGKTVKISIANMSPISQYKLTIADVTDLSEAKNVIIAIDKIFTPALCGQWRLNGDGKDNSGRGFDGIYHNVDNAIGVEAYAAQLKGTNDSYIEINNFDAPITNKFTLSAYVKTQLNGEYQVILAKNKKISGHYGIYLSPQGNICFFAPQMGDFQTTKMVADNSWHFITATYDGASLIIYCDGILQRSFPIVASLTVNSATLAIGRLTSMEDNVLFPLNGLIDYVSIYSVALTQSQINELMAKAISTHTVCKDVDIYDGQTLLQTIPRTAGSYTIKGNIYTNIALSAQLSVAIYKGDKLLDAYLEPITVSDILQFEQTVDIPQNEGDVSIKIMLFDSLSKIKPLCKSFEIK